MLRVNLVTDIRPEIPFQEQGFFRFLGMAGGQAILAHQGRILHARLEGRAEALPAPGQMFRAKMDREAGVLRIHEITPEPTQTARTPEIPEKLLGVFAELVHGDEIQKTEIARLHAYPFSDLICLPGVLEDPSRKRRARLTDGHARTKETPCYFLVKLEFERLGKVGLLFYSDRFDFRDIRLVISAAPSARAEIEPGLGKIPGVQVHFVDSGSSFVDRLA